MKNYEKFLLKCINNRELLGYSIHEMSDYLDAISEKEYEEFEKGKYLMNEENFKKIIRILAVDDIDVFNVNDYIDTEGLSEEEIEDLSAIVAQIVGEENA